MIKPTISLTNRNMHVSLMRTRLLAQSVTLPTGRIAHESFMHHGPQAAPALGRNVPQGR